MTHPIKSPRKLIEVALPLDAINAACAYEKMPGIGPHPRGIHLWWARRPLAAARAVIFAQLVNDPGYQQGGGFKYGKNKKEAAIERQRLFKIIEDLVLWKNTTNEEVLECARAEIRRSWREVCELNKDHPDATELFNPEKLPALHDPFAGGGAIPLEAQRLGLEAYASDLNPVAVLINKAMIEIPPKFAGRNPIGPLIEDQNETKKLALSHSWPGPTGLAEDVRRYGTWICEEAKKRIGHLYPPVELTAEMAHGRPALKPLIGQKLIVIAWIWVRTVKSPNPAFSHVEVPLASTFILSSKKGKEAYVQPVVEDDRYHFIVKEGSPPPEAKKGTKAEGRGSNFLCLISNSPISGDYIKTEGKAGRMGTRLMAVVAKIKRGRIYLNPTPEVESVAAEADPTFRPDSIISGTTQYLGCKPYGMEKFGDLFTPRQLVALTTLSDLVVEVREKIRLDAVDSGLVEDDQGIDAGGTNATAMMEAVCLYLAFAVDRCADFGNSLCGWSSSNQKVMHLFGKQALPMVWDFSEANILADTVGGFGPASEFIADCIVKLAPIMPGSAIQSDAQRQTISRLKFISTDPPYYDNVPYADISDFFYVWLRRSLRDVFTTTFSTMTVPKAEELVAFAYRHDGKKEAEEFFLDGMTQVISNLAIQSHPEGPITIYYAFKQAEVKESAGISSTGWETFLSAVLNGGFSIVGTWPLRSEQEFRLRNMGANALASSIVLVCRKRPADASTVSRRDFIRELNAALPEALDEMTKGSGDDHSPVAPVDLSQAVIGPGMAIFSKYTAVLESDGSPMSVRTALQLINRFLAEEDFDSDTQFCLHWFEQHGWSEGVFGDADTLSRAKGTSVEGVQDAGVVESGRGIVRLRKWSEYPVDWDPQADTRNPIWETLHHLIRALKQDGEASAGSLLTKLRGQAEAARQLAYRLYTLCDRRNWAEDARAYNELITSWTGIESAAGAEPTGPTQGKFFE
jgi:putative DNA methylase